MRRPQTDKKQMRQTAAEQLKKWLDDEKINLAKRRATNRKAEEAQGGCCYPVE